METTLERTREMGKLKSVERDGDLFVMSVELDGGHREKWTYERLDLGDGGKSYVLIGREQLR
jgi:hypothetical protein